MAFKLWVFFKQKSVLNPVFLLLAVLAAYSRPYLFQHFPEDLLGGAIVGTASAFFAVLIYEVYFEKKFPDLSKKGLFVHKI